MRLNRESEKYFNHDENRTHDLDVASVTKKYRKKIPPGVATLAGVVPVFDLKFQLTGCP